MAAGSRGLRETVFRANAELAGSGLVHGTFGNVSGVDRAAGVFVIKPSGVPYAELTPAHMVPVSLETGKVVDSRFRPSSDTPTHLELYRAFGCGGIVHTHSETASAFAQARLPIRCMGTTHADHFRGDVPVTRALTREEVEGEYERNTGLVIVERFRAGGISPEEVPAVLVANHGPFTWGKRRLRGGGARARPRVRGAHGGERPPARARRGAPRGVPGGPALPAQARPRRLLRPALVRALRLHGDGRPAPARGGAPRAARGRDARARHRGRPLRLRPALVRRGRDRRDAAHAAARARPRARGDHRGRAARGDRPGRPVRVLRRSASTATPISARRVRFAGHGADDGGLREWMAWPERASSRCPTRSATPTARCSSRSAWRFTPWTWRTSTRAPRVGVFGCGPIGLLALQAARLAGAGRLFATDSRDRPHRLEAARRLGAEVFAAEAGREALAIRDALGGPGSTSRSSSRGRTRRSTQR